MSPKLLSIALLLALFACDTPENERNRFFLRANDFLAEGNYTQAKKFYQEALKIDSSFSDAWNNLGVLYFEQKKYNEAIASYAKALQFDSVYFDARMNMGNALLGKMDYFSAKTVFSKLSVDYPDSLKLVFGEALAAQGLGNEAEAIQLFDQVIAQEPKHLEALTNKGILLMNQGHNEAAGQVLETALAVNSDNADLLNAYGSLKNNVEAYQEAIVYFDKAIAQYPKDAYFLNNRGFSYLMLADLDKAQEDIEQSLLINTDNAWAWRNKGVLTMKKKNYSEAISLLKKALQLESDLPLAQYYLGLSQWETGDKSGACETWIHDGEAKSKSAWTLNCE